MKIITLLILLASLADAQTIGQPGGNTVVQGTLSGNAANLTNLNASSLSSGTIDAARLPSNVVTNARPAVDFGGVFIYDNKVEGARISIDLANGFWTGGDLIVDQGISLGTGTISGSGSGLTNLNASALTTGTLPAGRLNVGITNLAGWLEVTNGGQHYQTFNAANLTNISDSALSANIARLDTAQTWSGVQNFTNSGNYSGVTITNRQFSNISLLKFVSGTYIDTTSISLPSNGEFRIANGTGGGLGNDCYISRAAVGTFSVRSNLWLCGTIIATNGYIYPPKSSGPTWAQVGVSNTIITWSSNNIPPTLYGSYFDAASNRTDKVLLSFP